MSQPDQGQPRADFFEGRRVAFFGGSFDPPHLGHVAVARAALVGLELDKVLFAPVGAQPLKRRGSTASFEDRLAMTRLAIAGEPRFDISLADAPNALGEPNYSLETLERLRAELGTQCRLYFLMGADSFLGLNNWHRASEIPFAASLIVASRPGEHLEGVKSSLPQGLTIEATPERDRIAGNVDVRAYEIRNGSGERAEFYLLPGLDCEISATRIRGSMRKRAGAGKDDAEGERLVPEAVAEYVRAHGLYR
ncbi:MAG TPA: nicotinate (nicotinamide) nucleotide adenylyltransferase [Terracidiphilus sp.]|nr:nicotinate (nicotinamide) nucleotide adenylyltransferase [Terracidiphilus sp.]